MNSLPSRYVHTSVSVSMDSIFTRNFVLGMFGHHGNVVVYVLLIYHGVTIINRSTISVCARSDDVSIVKKQFFAFLKIIKCFMIKFT